MAIITLLRHAPVALKYQKRYIGHSDISIDIKLINQTLLNKLKNKNFDFVYSSDLKRCTQTLELLKLNYTKDKNLREVKFKEEFELKNFKEIEQMNCFDKRYLDSFNSWHKFICDETINEYKKRVEKFLRTLPKNKDILVCSHGGTIKMIESILKNKDYETSSFAIEYLNFIDINIS